MATREGTAWQAPVTFERATGSFPSISRHLNAGEIEGATQQTRQTTDFLKAGLNTPHTTLNFVRHGKVENPTGVVYERIPGFHLSQLGHAQAQATARWMAEQPEIVRSAAFFSSPLDRTLDTSDHILNAVNEARAELGLPALTIQTDERLMEVWNVFRGQRPGKGEAALWKHNNWKRILNLKRPGWGEPYSEVAQRMQSFAFEMVKRYPGQNVIVVAHESPIWTLRHVLTTGKASSNILTRGTALASVTSLTFNQIPQLVQVDYHDPAKDVALS